MCLKANKKPGLQTKQGAVVVFPVEMDVCSYWGLGQLNMEQLFVIALQFVVFLDGSE